MDGFVVKRPQTKEVSGVLSLNGEFEYIFSYSFDLETVLVAFCVALITVSCSSPMWSW